jgi:hypothetical protein
VKNKRTRNSHRIKKTATNKMLYAIIKILFLNMFKSF